MDWKTSLTSDTRLKYLVSSSSDYSQREFESQISKQQSIGDLKVVKDKLQDSLDLLNTELSSNIHQHLPLLIYSVEAVLKGFEGMQAEAKEYKAVSQMVEM